MKVCIVGFSEMNRWWANQQPPDVEVWGMNEGHSFMQRWDRWFQIHPRDWSEERKRKAGIVAPPEPDTFGRGQQHVQFLKALKVPLYMREVMPDFPTSVRYPYEEIPFRRDDGTPYITSSAAYMLALAVHEGADEIRLAGVEMKAGTEYVKQRPCFEFWIGVAKARGIKVVLPPTGCSLLSGDVYAA